MAKYLGVLTGFPDVDYSAGSDAIERAYKEQQRTMAALEAVSDTLPDGEVVGGVLQFQIADGYAYYLVMEATARSISLKLIPWGDSYQIPAPMMRGLTRKDALLQLKQRKAFKAMFAKKAS